MLVRPPLACEFTPAYNVSLLTITAEIGMDKQWTDRAATIQEALTQLRDSL